MINKSFKIIHNKYLRFFKFIFFLRYLFLIFFVSLVLFLSIPNFFNYEKKSQFIKEHISKKYNYDILEYEKIEFEILPLPKLNIKNARINLKSTNINVDTENLIIFPKLLSLYNYENFQSKKIIYKNNNIVLDFSALTSFVEHLFNQKNKLFIDNLNLKIIDKEKTLFNIGNIKFANFGYNKNLILGNIFDKKFKIKIDNDFKNYNFKLINSGINTEVIFKKNSNNFISGIFKSKILNNNIKFDFDYNKKILKIHNSYFRSKDFSFNNKSEIVFAPFLSINSVVQIEEINPTILKK